MTMINIEYKGCDSAEQLEDGTIKVIFRNGMTGNFWQHIFPADCGLTVTAIINWKNGKSIQTAMPTLTPDQREHFLTGFTQKEINEIFGE